MPCIIFAFLGELLFGASARERACVSELCSVRLYLFSRGCSAGVRHRRGCGRGMIYFQFERILGRCARAHAKTPPANDESEVDVAINISGCGCAHHAIVVRPHRRRRPFGVFAADTSQPRSCGSDSCRHTNGTLPTANLLIRLRGRPLLGAAGVCQSFNYYQLLAGTITGAH